MPEKRATALVDGENIHHMMKDAGFSGLVSAGALMRHIRYYMGLAPTHFPTPAITLLPDFAAGKKGEAFRGAGFDVISVGGLKEEDDEALKERLLTIDPAKTDEVLLISNDGGFAPVLRTLVQQGIRVVWAVADLPDPRGRSTMSRACLQPCFIRFDMRPILRRIDYDPERERPRERPLGRQLRR